MNFLDSFSVVLVVHLSHLSCLGWHPCEQEQEGALLFLFLILIFGPYGEEKE